jgi:ABC-2 type transport system permease protein
LLVSTLIADSFAGERERHTLETLLASRLPDDVILLGKILASVIYGWTVTLLILLVAAVTVNLAHWGGTIAFYEGLIGPAAVALSLLLSLTTAAAGALCSVRAATVRQAQATLTLAIMACGLVPGLVYELMSADDRTALLAHLATADLMPPLLALLGMLALANALLLAVARAQFRRSRLILS